MSDMVERVARAIAAADEQNGGLPYEARIAIGEHAKEHLFDQARAAIEAMGETLDLHPDLLAAIKAQADLDNEIMKGLPFVVCAVKPGSDPDKL